jgi:signal transduction histidine kinase
MVWALGKLNRGIRGKLLRRVVPLVVAPVILLGVVVVIGVNNLADRIDSDLDDLEASLGDRLVGPTVQDSAESVADGLTLFLATKVADVRALASTPSVIDTAARGAELAAETGLDGLSVDEAEAEGPEANSLEVSPQATAFLRSRMGDVYSEVSFTDANGLNVAASGQAADFVQRDDESWTRAWDAGVAIAPLSLDESTGRWVMGISARIDDPISGERLGVLTALLDAAVIARLTDSAVAGTEDAISIFLPDGRLVAETASGHDEARLLSEGVNAATLGNPRVAAAFTGGREGFVIDDAAVAGHARPDLADTAVTSLVPEGTPAAEALAGWTVFVERPRGVAFASLDDLVDYAVEQSRRVFVIAMLATILVAAVAAVIAVRIVARRIVDPVQDLSAAARQAADEKLPATVAAVEHLEPGQPPPTPDPIVIRTGDELEELARSINTLQTTATDLAVGEAFARRQRTDLFLNLGRRNQNLVSKQLEHLERLERDESDPEVLQDLLTLDHLATRMRRNAESLLVLAGLETPRRWTEPVPIRDVIRAAAAEIRDFERVELRDVEDGQVRGEMASDVVHLIAELLENAAHFSSPGTDIEVFGRWRGSVYSISVVDHGLGMAPERLQEVNRRLSHPDLFSDASGTYLGLFVVGKLAARYDIGVRLIESPAEGTTAKIVLPANLILRSGGPRPHDADDAATVLVGSPPVDAGIGAAASAPAAAPEPVVAAVQAAAPVALADEAAAVPPPPPVPLAAAAGPVEITPSGFQRRVPGQGRTPGAPAPAGTTPSGFQRRVPGASGGPPPTDPSAPLAEPYVPDDFDEAAETARQRFGALQSGVRSGQERPPAPAWPADVEPAGNGSAGSGDSPWGDGAAGSEGGEAAGSDGAEAAEKARSRFGSLQAGLRAGQDARDDEEAR